jgi:predicted ArsR family transcriptional regulator
MVKRSSYSIKKSILLQVQEKPASYAQLERKLSTGYRTVKSNCEELADYDLIKVESMKQHPTNGKPFHIVKITSKGIENLKKKR